MKKLLTLLFATILLMGCEPETPVTPPSNPPNNPQVGDEIRIEYNVANVTYPTYTRMQYMVQCYLADYSLGGQSDGQLLFTTIDVHNGVEAGFYWDTTFTWTYTGLTNLNVHYDIQDMQNPGGVYENDPAAGGNVKVYINDVLVESGSGSNYYIDLQFNQ